MLCRLWPFGDNEANYWFPFQKRNQPLPLQSNISDGNNSEGQSGSHFELEKEMADSAEIRPGYDKESHVCTAVCVSEIQVCLQIWNTNLEQLVFQIIKTNLKIKQINMKCINLLRALTVALPQWEPVSTTGEILQQWWTFPGETSLPKCFIQRSKNNCRSVPSVHDSTIRNSAKVASGESYNTKTTADQNKHKSSFHI